MRALNALVLVFVALCCFAVADAAIGSAFQPRALAPLFTYYYEISEPTVQPSTRTAVRPGRTALTISYSEPKVSRHMPVIVPATSGSIHDVINTWQALKNLAYMFKRLEPINVENARTGNQPQLFPQAHIGLRAAAEVPSQGMQDLPKYIDMAEAKGKRYIWATDASSSLMLWPFDLGLTAVADLISVSYDEATNSITLEVDLVDKPHTTSEFQPHQTLDVESAHYDFNTDHGVDVNAPALLQKLKASDYKVKGLHVFAKAFFPVCCHITLSTNPPSVEEALEVPVGSQVNITISDILYDCDAFGCGGPDACSDDEGNFIGGNFSVPRANLFVELQGPAFPVDYSGLSNRRKASVVTQQYPVRTVNGAGWFVAQVADDAQDIIISNRGLYDLDLGLRYLTLEPNTITITGQALPPPGPSLPPVAKLLLHPTKAYRLCDDPITLTAQALDAASLPVANATVTFAIFGDCKPTADTDDSTTNAAGMVSVTLRSDTPGAVAVVAAAANAQGVAVLSDPSNVIFFDEHRYVEDRESDYYGGDHHLHDDDDKPYGRDAESYATAAAKLAKQQLITYANV